LLLNHKRELKIWLNKHNGGGHGGLCAAKDNLFLFFFVFFCLFIFNLISIAISSGLTHYNNNICINNKQTHINALLPNNT
jgi:hypothetical protein